MTDDPRTHHDDGELLAAYLADELDDLEVHRLERRLLDDAQLRRQLDDVHEAVLAVQSPDDVDPPAGLDARIVERVRAADAGAAAGNGEVPGPSAGASGPRRSTGSAATPWWRRPVAAVAAVALLGVVAVSWIGVATLTGGGDDAGTVTAMSADEAAPEADAAPDSGGAEEMAEAQPEAGAGGTAEAPGGADAAAADGDAAAATSQEGAADDTAIGPLIEASPAGLVEAPALDDAGQRRDYLIALTDTPARAALRAATPQETAAIAAQQRTTLRGEAGLDETCVDTLVSPDGPAALRLVSAQIDGREAVGAVLPTAGGGLRLQLVASGGGCDLVADDVLAPDEGQR